MKPFPWILFLLLGCEQDTSAECESARDGACETPSLTCDPPRTLPAWREWRDPAQGCLATREYMGCVRDVPCGVGGNIRPGQVCNAGLPAPTFCGLDGAQNRYYCTATSRQTGDYEPTAWGSAVWIYRQFEAGLLSLDEPSVVDGGRGAIAPEAVRACWPELEW